MKPLLEVADILREYLHEYEQKYGLLSVFEKIQTDAIIHCRTAAIGGKVMECDACGEQKIIYHSCRNRHCPKCQQAQREQWMIDREAELLPVNYFHTVFTLAHELNELFLYNKSLLYHLLFECAWQTISHFAQDPKYLGARGAMLALLHTWGRALDYHVHLHCIIPGGGLSDKNKWKYAHANGQYLFPVKELSAYYKNLMLAGIKALFDAEKLYFRGQGKDLFNVLEFNKIMETVSQKDWVVFVKPPFNEPLAVLNYHARYSNRIAISNYRLIELKDDHVSFHYFDYKTGQKRVMSLHAVEFIRRFLQHFLPNDFRKIRYYGFFSATKKKKELALCMYLLDQRLYVKPKRYNTIELFDLAYNIDICMCRVCNAGRMVKIYDFQPTRGDPLLDLMTIGIIRKV